MEDHGIKVTEHLASLYASVSLAIKSVEFKQKISCWQFSQTWSGRNSDHLGSCQLPKRIWKTELLLSRGKFQIDILNDTFVSSCALKGWKVSENMSYEAVNSIDMRKSTVESWLLDLVVTQYYHQSAVWKEGKEGKNFLANHVNT